MLGLKNCTSDNRRILHFTSARRDIEKSDDYNMYLQIRPVRDAPFKRISLISASFTNKFLTIQGNETNESFTFNMNIQIAHNSGSPVKFYNVSKTFTLEEGYYDEDHLLSMLNSQWQTLSLKSILPEEGQAYVTDDADLFLKNLELKFLDDNSSRLHLIYPGRTSSGDYKITLMDLSIYFPNLTGKLFGVNLENANVVIRKWGSAVIGEGGFDYHFPALPVLTWVSTVQLRIDLVDSSENDSILYNIPIQDFYQPYISFVNPQVEDTALTYSDGGQDLKFIHIYLTNQDGYDIKIGNIGCFFDILLF